jgi:hypothetical protein
VYCPITFFYVTPPSTTSLFPQRKFLLDENDIARLFPQPHPLQQQQQQHLQQLGAGAMEGAP